MDPELELQNLRIKFKALQSEQEKVERERDSWKQKYNKLQKEKSDDASDTFDFEVWEDVRNKIQNDTDAVKQLIINETITMNDTVPTNGYSLLHWAAFYGIHPLPTYIRTLYR